MPSLLALTSLFLAAMALAASTPSAAGQESAPAQQRAPGAADATGAPRPNVLVVLLDDVGVDAVGAYGVSPHAGPTPTLDAIASQSRAFRNAYAMPGCSPTRATILTGALPGRHGVGRPIGWNSDSFTPDPSAHGSWLARLRDEGWRTAAVGKWHLEVAVEPEPYQSAIGWGAEVYTGMPQNPNALGASYFAWQQVHAEAAGHRVQPATGYLTSREVDDALSLIESFGNQPWAVWLAFHAAHAPFHAPPDALHSYGDLTGADEPTLFRAAVEAIDTELSRLLTGIRPEVLARTIVVVMGDNGTPADATLPPFDPDHAKATTFENGVKVPLMIWTDRVEPGWTDALASCADIGPTILELAGVPYHPAEAPDGLSLRPMLLDAGDPGPRSVAIVHLFKPNGFGEKDENARAATDGRWKLHLVKPDIGASVWWFFDLDADPLEQTNLLALGQPSLEGEALAAFDTLSTALASLP